MRCLLIVGLLFLVGCATHAEIMTRDTYAELEVGTKASEIERRFGRPYQIVSREGDKETYEYIEKITMGNQVIEQRRYYIVIQEGKVIGKYMKLSNPPPFEAIYSEDPYPNY